MTRKTKYPDILLVLLLMHAITSIEGFLKHDHDEKHHGDDASGHKDAFDKHIASFGGRDNGGGWTITKPGYDSRVRPPAAAAGEPTVVKVFAFSDFIETVDEHSSEVVAAFFLKAVWHDPRLRPVEEILEGMLGFTDTLPLPGEVKHHIWVPDLSLPMARRVAIPTIHQPAESVTLTSNSTVIYSAFFVISFYCPMIYRNYPLDEQQCDLDIMSYMHNNRNLRLHWEVDGLRGHRRFSTRHFDVLLLRPRGESELTRRGADGEKDVLRIRFFMRRRSTFHVIQIYVPSALLVVIGWLSLLVPLDFAYGRMVLAVTTLLVLVSFFVTTSQTSPGVNEVKAVDMWLFMCICFVFSAIVNCIADLRFLSMVEKESQIAGEAEPDPPPVVDERLRGRHVSRPADAAGSAPTYSVVFHGDNTPFQADKEVLIATPAVLKWLKLAVYLERGMTVIYPSLFVLFTAVYWGVYLSRRSTEDPPSEDPPHTDGPVG